MCNLRWAQKQAELWVWVESIGLTESSMECLLCAKQWEETRNLVGPCLPRAHLLMRKQINRRKSQSSETRALTEERDAQRGSLTWPRGGGLLKEEITAE